MSLPAPSAMPLPAELLEFIVDATGPGTLKNLRLANKDFHYLATPRLFAEYHMGLFQYALDNFEAIATSPFAKHVQKITLHCDILPAWTKERWCLYNSLQVDTHATDQAYQRLTRLRQEQFRWHLSGSNSLRFRECFARLDCIKEAEVIRAQDVDDEDLNAPATRYWTSLRQKIYIRPEASAFPGVYSPTQDANVIHGSELAALNLLAAISFRSSFSGTESVNRVTLSNLDHDFRRHLSFHGAAYASNPIYPLFSIPCANFTELSLVSKDVPLGSRHLASEWVALLRESINLRCLKLSCRRSPASFHNLRTHVLDELLEEGPSQLPPMTWPHLEEAQLSIEISHIALVSFLRRHANTLCVIKLQRALIWGDISPCLNMLTQNFDVERVPYSPKPRFGTLHTVLDRHHEETSLIGRRKVNG